jgi:hypothetical protein
MKKLLLVVSAIMLVSAVMAQKVINDKNAEVRNVKNFHGVRVSNGIHLYLTQGNDEAVAVSASDPDYRDRIKTEVDNGILKIYVDKSDWKFWDDFSKKKLKAYVSVKVIDQLRASSGSQVDVDGSIKSGDLDMDFSSGASFTGNVEVTKLKIQSNSGAEANITGTAGNCEVEVSSGSSLDGYGLQTDICDASTSSGANLRITVNKELSASASSGGQIHYKGTGVIKEISTGSGGEVSKR